MKYWKQILFVGGVIWWAASTTITLKQVAKSQESIQAVQATIQSNQVEFAGYLADMADVMQHCQSEIRALSTSTRSIADLSEGDLQEVNRGLTKMQKSVDAMIELQKRKR